MFNPANETHFSLNIEGVEHDLQVLEFSGREAISQPYRFDVELISERPDIDLESLLHQRAFLQARTSEQGAGQGDADTVRRHLHRNAVVVDEQAWLQCRCITGLRAPPGPSAGRADGFDQGMLLEGAGA